MSAWATRPESSPTGSSWLGDIHNDAITSAFVPDGAQTRYLIERREDAWMITFDGEEFGPYKTEREAMLFAIDAA